LIFVIGALIIGVLNNTLDLMNVSAIWQQIVKGCIIVGAVILDQLRIAAVNNTYFSLLVPGVKPPSPSISRLRACSSRSPLRETFKTP
jgi:hypothetical protein